MKKFLKVLCLVLVLTLAIAPAVSLAADNNNKSLKEQISVTDEGVLGGNAMATLFSKGASTLQFVGYGVAIVMVIWLGIQWMLAQPAKKAELKGKMWSMAIGIILIVAGSTIIGALWGASGDLSSQLSSSKTELAE